MVIPLLCLALLIVSFFAKIPGGVKWAAIVVGVAALQIALALVSFDAPWIGILHGLNAFALAGVAGRAAREASVATGASTPSTRSRLTDPEGAAAGTPAPRRRLRALIATARGARDHRPARAGSGGPA